jgi:hypothetical protein
MRRLETSLIDRTPKGLIFENKQGERSHTRLGRPEYFCIVNFELVAEDLRTWVAIRIVAYALDDSLPRSRGQHTSCSAALNGKGKGLLRRHFTRKNGCFGGLIYAIATGVHAFDAEA